MSCDNVNDCPCPKLDCENRKKCCACVARHKETDNLPACLRDKWVLRS